MRPHHQNRPRRLLAALVVAAVTIGSSVSAQAQAPLELSTFNSQQCATFEATTGTIQDAWHLERLQLPTVWRMATGKGITVAVIDTGVSTVSTPYYTPDRVTQYDYLTGQLGANATDQRVDCKHGTVVASLIAAGRPNGQPVDTRTNFSGIAPDVHLLTYRALLYSSPEGEQRDTLDATIASIYHAVDNGADIINLSQAANGSDPQVPALTAAVKDAIRAGVVVVAAAGNTDMGLSGAAFPASIQGVIAVGISARSDAPSQASYPGTAVAVGAPGEDLIGLVPSPLVDNAIYSNQAYEGGLVGSSFAAPIVSGIVALMQEHALATTGRKLTPEEVRTRLIETADPPPAAAPDYRIGYGVVNPLRALTGLSAPTQGNPQADATTVPMPIQPPEQRDPLPLQAGLAIGVTAALGSLLGLVVAIALPAAIKRRRLASGRKQQSGLAP